MIVMKFGGTSVGNAERITNVARIVSGLHKKKPVVVVVSAMHKVTDLLVDSARSAAEKNHAQFEKNLRALHDLHKQTLNDLKLDPKSQNQILKIINTKLSELEKTLKTVERAGKITPQNLDKILSFGERLSIHLVAGAIIKLGEKAKAVEASDLIVTTNDFGNASPLLAKSSKKTKPVLAKLHKANIIPVITGFIGATGKGEITTFGRGGSDFSATIIANCLDAREVWIWKDVDGAMTADPKLVPDARTIPSLSYDEAAELSYFGAKVLHPMTMVPASDKDIPIRIKNTFKPSFVGTEIMKKSNHTSKYGKAISSLCSLSLITLQGKGMIGVPGVAAKAFSAISAKKINVLFISQASSEYNITFAIKKDQGEKAIQALKKTFSNELQKERIENIYKEDDVAIIAIIGEGMKGKPGIAGRIFSALGDASINIVAIAQGSSERNISLVISEKDVIPAIQNIHNRIISAS